MNYFRSWFSALLVSTFFALVVGCADESSPEPNSDLERYYQKSELEKYMPKMIESPGEAPEVIVGAVVRDGDVPARPITPEEIKLQKRIDVLVFEVSEMKRSNTSGILEKVREIQELAQQLPEPAAD